MPTAAIRMIAGGHPTTTTDMATAARTLIVTLGSRLIGDGSRQLLRTSLRLQRSLLVHKPRLSRRGFPCTATTGNRTRSRPQEAHATYGRRGRASKSLADNINGLAKLSVRRRGPSACGRTVGQSGRWRDHPSRLGSDIHDFFGAGWGGVGEIGGSPGVPGVTGP